MDSQFELWKKDHGARLQEMMGLQYFNSSVLTNLGTAKCSCCGLYAGLSERPKGVELEVSDSPLSPVSGHEWVTFDQIQLESGKWLNMQFFTPPDTSGWDEIYPTYDEPNALDSSDIYCLSIEHLNSATVYRSNGYRQWYYDRQTGGEIGHNFQIDFDYVKQLKSSKDKEIVVVELPGVNWGHAGWLSRFGLEDTFEVKYESPRFHNRPYHPEDGSPLNYLQLKVLKVK